MRITFFIALLLLLLSCDDNGTPKNSVSYKHYNRLLLETEKTVYNDTAKTAWLLKQPVDPTAQDAVAQLLQNCQILSFKGDNVKCDSLAKMAMGIARANKDEVGVYFANSFFSEKDSFANKDKLDLAAHYKYYEATKKDDPYFHEEVVHDLINILLAAQHYDEAAKYIREQHALATQLKDSIVWYGYYSNKATELFEHYGTDSLPAADAYMDKAISICPKWKHLDYHIALSNKDWLRGHTDVAGIERNIAASVRYHYFDVADYTNIIGYYYKAGDVQKCLYYFNLIEQKCIDNRDYDDLIYMYNHVSNLYMKVGDYKKALSYYKKKQWYEAQSGEQQLRQRIEELEALYRAKETNASLAKQQQLNILLVVLAAVLLVTLLLFWIVNARRKKTAQKRYLEIAELLKARQEKEVELQANTKAPEGGLHPSGKPAPKAVEEELAERITTGLQKLEAEGMFLKSDFKATVVAQRLGTNTNYLSQYFAGEKKKTFPEYTQELRINYVLNRLKDDKTFRKFTLQAIAEEIGYKNATTFVRIFKAQTGISPAFYIDEINKESKA